MALKVLLKVCQGLANRQSLEDLDSNYIDMDALIENVWACPLRDFFAEKGEMPFVQEWSPEVLRLLKTGSSCQLAEGSASFSERNRDLLKPILITST